MRKYIINESYFKDIDSKEKAYFLGFLFADGYVSIKNNLIELTLKSNDIEILEKLRNAIYIDQTRPILKVKKGKYLRLNISSKKMVSDLINLGCVTKKTFVLKYPDISKNFYSDFIRGYFDGDGSISIVKKTLHFSLVGTVELLERIQKIFIEICQLTLTKLDNRHPNRYNNIRSLRYGGNVNCYRIYRFLYEEGSIFLKRKKEIFEKILINKTYSKEIKPISRKERQVYYNNQIYNITELSKVLSIELRKKASTIRRQIYSGWSIDKIKIS